MKEILDCNSMYSIDGSGNVFSKYSNKIIKQRNHCKGYKEIELKVNGKKKIHKVHRLVYQTHIGQIPEGYQINHKNGNKTDNTLSNLELTTPKENQRHAINSGLFRKMNRREDGTFKKYKGKS